MSAILEFVLTRAFTIRAGKKGQTLVEYALILAILSIVMIAVFTLLGARIVIIFSAITNILDTAQTPPPAH
jgi:Flp pilus assembly pilin Flp